MKEGREKKLRRDRKQGDERGKCVCVCVCVCVGGK